MCIATHREPGTDFADHAPALGAFGLVSNHSFATRWVL